MKAPQFANEGKYETPVTARSSSETLKETLTVSVSGSCDLVLGTPTDRLSDDATAGKEKMIKLQVTNVGSSDLKDIQLIATVPRIRHVFDFIAHKAGHYPLTIESGDRVSVIMVSIE